MSLNGRVALITGATGSLGRVVARELADAGASLILVGTDAGRLDALAADLALPAGRVTNATADLRDGAASREELTDAVGRAGRLDVVAHLVGGYAGGTPLAEEDPETLRSMLEQHAWTTFNLVRAVVPHLAAGGWGRVVAVSAAAATAPAAKLAAYAAGKAAEEALLLSLARDLAGSGVTANLLVVKSIDAEHTGKAGWTTPEQISGAIRWLCSDEAGVISGARIPLFGG
jgi:NAD(P)-dependent dehydrogenase (short-subunit alcohol dehydrogenase family)